MARRPARKSLFRVESLESREVLSGPSAEMQELLWMTNFARQHPADAANWATSDLTTDNLGLTLQSFHVNIDEAKNDISSRPAAQPLAWNDQLASAANTLSQYQAQSGQQTHTGSGGTLADGTRVGVTLSDRLSNAGYLNSTASGENAFAYATSARNATEAFLLDWGNDRSVLPHLTNLMNPSFREAGFASVATSNKGLGPEVITQDFGSRAGQKPMLVGVAFNATATVQPDRRYEAGEGVGGVSIDVTNSQGVTQTVQTWDAGGYQLALDPGHYTVTARVGDKVIRSQGVDIGTQNVEVDFVLSDPLGRNARDHSADPRDDSGRDPDPGPGPGRDGDPDDDLDAHSDAGTGDLFDPGHDPARRDAEGGGGDPGRRHVSLREYDSG